MKLEELNKEYDKLQIKYGTKELNSIYNGGCTENPDICFVFMNPTAKIIASEKSWLGIKAPWIGIKNIWDLFYNLNLVDEKIYQEIKNKKRNEWTPLFAEKVYEDVKKHKYSLCPSLCVMEL